MSQRWLQRSQSNATFELDHLWFASFCKKIRAQENRRLSESDLTSGRLQKLQLSINLRLVSVNNTHGTVPALISEAICLAKQCRIRDLRVNKHFLLLFRHSQLVAEDWLCDMRYPASHVRQWTGYWLSWWNRLVMCFLSFSSPTCITGRMTSPTRAPTKDVHVLMPGTCGYVIFRVSREILPLAWVNDLEMGIILDYLGGPSIVTGGPYKEGKRIRVLREDIRMEAEVGRKRMNHCSLWDGGESLSQGI